MAEEVDSNWKGAFGEVQEDYVHYAANFIGFHIVHKFKVGEGDHNWIK